MKRTYTKPELFYENFNLIAPIASCDYQLASSGSVEACGAMDNDPDSLTYGMTIFSSACDVEYSPYNGYTPGAESFITSS